MSAIGEHIQESLYETVKRENPQCFSGSLQKRLKICMAKAIACIEQLWKMQKEFSPGERVLHYRFDITEPKNRVEIICSTRDGACSHFLDVEDPIGRIWIEEIKKLRDLIEVFTHLDAIGCSIQ